MAQRLGAGWCWGEKPESSPGQEAQCLAGFLGPAKEGAGALSYRGWLGQGRGSGEGGGKSMEMGDLQHTGGHSLQPGGRTQGALRALGGGRVQRGHGDLCSVQPSFQSQALHPGLSLPAELCDSWGSSKGGILLNPTGGGSHLLPPPSTSSCHVLGHQCFKIYWFLAGCLFRNQKHQVLNSFPQL